MNCYIFRMFILCIIFDQVLLLHLETKPSVIQYGVTKNFTVLCEVTKGSEPRFSWLTSIILSRSVQSEGDKHLTLATINSLTGLMQMIDSDLIGRGVIDNNGDSFISVTWLYPTNAMAGKYMCEAYGVDSTWRSVTVNAKVLVDASTFNITLLLDELIQLHKTVDELKKTSTHLNRSLDELKASSEIVSAKLEESKTWFFKRSEVYKGRRYYLSQQDPISRSEQSMATCVLYGGYLAEIDDLSEFNFIKTFIKQFSGFRLVLIGGTDEETEEVWKYRYSKTMVPQILVKSRGFGRAGNCLYMYDLHDWLAVDDRCYFNLTEYPTRFLCEIPETTL